jgi:hypothetical protein
MAALGNKPLQIAAAAGVIFDEQNFHSGEANYRRGCRVSHAPGATSLRRSESCLGFEQDNCQTSD